MWRELTGPDVPFLAAPTRVPTLAVLLHTSTAHKVSRKNNPNSNVDWRLHSTVQVGKQVKYTQAKYTNRHQHAHMAFTLTPRSSLFATQTIKEYKYSLVLCIRLCTCMRAFMHVCVVCLTSTPRAPETVMMSARVSSDALITPHSPGKKFMIRRYC